MNQLSHQALRPIAALTILSCLAGIAAKVYRDRDRSRQQEIAIKTIGGGPWYIGKPAPPDYGVTLDATVHVEEKAIVISYDLVNRTDAAIWDMTCIDDVFCAPDRVFVDFAGLLLIQKELLPSPPGWADLPEPILRLLAAHESRRETIRVPVPPVVGSAVRFAALERVAPPGPHASRSWPPRETRWTKTLRLEIGVSPDGNMYEHQFILSKTIVLDRAIEVLDMPLLH